jgi:molybdopterin adenylyltransferase
MSNPHHKSNRVVSVDCAVITVSDTRTPETDSSGRLIRELLERNGHRVISCDIIPDDPQQVRGRVEEQCNNDSCQAVLLTGGTGIALRDTTYEAIVSLLEKRLDGFGELFRMLSYEQIGAAAMLSRAVAGIRGRTAIFSMPGSTKAVELAMEKLILPELGHAVALLDTGSV